MQPPQAVWPTTTTDGRKQIPLGARKATPTVLHAEVEDRVVENCVGRDVIPVELAISGRREGWPKHGAPGWRRCAVVESANVMIGWGRSWPHCLFKGSPVVTVGTYVNEDVSGLGAAESSLGDSRVSAADPEDGRSLAGRELWEELGSGSGDASDPGLVAGDERDKLGEGAHYCAVLVLQVWWARRLKRKSRTRMETGKVDDGER